MRMFLIAMTDIFLILYLTTTASAPSTSIFTVEDFFKLKNMHETLQEDKQEAEEKFEDQIRMAQEEKNALAAQLAQEQKRAEEVEKSLLISDAELERINRDLQAKENMLEEREQLLKDLSQKIESKEALWQTMEASYKEDLQNQKELAQANRMVAEQLQQEAQKAQRLADQMQTEAELAYKTAEQSKAVQQNAILLRDEALKEKKKAEQKAHKAMQARIEAEEEKKRVLKAAEEVKKIKEKIEQKAEELAVAIKEIKQDGDVAYQNNVRPQLQQVDVTYKRELYDEVTVYEREFALLPVEIKSMVFIIVPLRQIGFTRSSNKAPEELVITYKGQKLTRGWINTQEGLIAIELQGYEGTVYAPYPKDMDKAQLMPALLALRNNSNKGLVDSLRGLSDEYFIVNRDHIESDESDGLVYRVTGLRGTGMRGERIIQGDQLVDLNGRLVGIANEADHIVRVDSVDGWEERLF